MFFTSFIPQTYKPDFYFIVSDYPFLTLHLGETSGSMQQYTCQGGIIYFRGNAAIANKYIV